MSTINISDTLHAIPILLNSKKKFVLGWPWGLAWYLLIVGNGFPPLRPTFLLLFSMFFIASSVYIYNDIQDAEMDRENVIKKNRPIASGNIRSETAQILVYMFGFIGLGLAWMVNVNSFVMIFTYFVLFYAYSHPITKLKNRFLGKDFTLVIANPILALAASYAVSNDFSLLALQCSSLTALYVLTQAPIANEASDIEEDIKYGVKSISTLLSWDNKLKLMFLGLIAQMVLLPFIQIQYGVNFMLPVFSIAMLLLVLISSNSLLRVYNLENFNKAHKIGALYQMVLPITFIIISMQVQFFF